MKSSIGASLILSLLVAVMAQAQGTGDSGKASAKKEPAKAEKSVGAFMRRKLELSQQALEGIVNEDYALIKKSADELEKMGRQKEWEVFALDDYQHLSVEFRRIAKSLSQAAEKQNLDGSAMAYMQLTMSCVECHKFTRRVRLADITPQTKWNPAIQLTLTD
jgi:hypothetical protein